MTTLPANRHVQLYLGKRTHTIPSSQPLTYAALVREAQTHFSRWLKPSATLDFVVISDEDASILEDLIENDTHLKDYIQKFLKKNNDFIGETRYLRLQVESDAPLIEDDEPERPP
jgi:hypothetical protein